MLSNTENKGKIEGILLETELKYGSYTKDGRTVDTIGGTITVQVDKEINGTVLRARWGDICEYYIADKKYEPGTLVMFGGEKEITISDGKICNAIVTTKPGFILNGDATNSNETY